MAWRDKPQRYKRKSFGPNKEKKTRLALTDEWLPTSASGEEGEGEGRGRVPARQNSI